MESGPAAWAPSYVNSNATSFAKPFLISLFKVACSVLKPESHDHVLFFHPVCRYLEFPCFCFLFVWLLPVSSFQYDESFTVAETSSASFTAVLPGPRTSSGAQ